MHIFPYSKRPGTPAAQRPDQILNHVKEERAHRAAAVAGAMEQRYLSRWLGETVSVLFEEQRDGAWHGYTTRYVPVCVESAENLHNCLRDVHILSAEHGTLRGELA